MKLFFNDTPEVFSYRNGNFVKPVEKFMKFVYEVETPDILLIFYPYGNITFNVNYRVVEMKGTKLEDGNFFYVIAIDKNKLEILDGKLCLMLLKSGHGYLKTIKSVNLSKIKEGK